MTSRLRVGQWIVVAAAAAAGGLFFGIVGWIVGADYSENFCNTCEFTGERGYEATGQIGFLVGGAIGFFLNPAATTSPQRQEVLAARIALDTSRLVLQKLGGRLHAQHAAALGSAELTQSPCARTRSA